MTTIRSLGSLSGDVLVRDGALTDDLLTLTEASGALARKISKPTAAVVA